jgi:hypothetical protein
MKRNSTVLTSYLFDFQYFGNTTMQFLHLILHLHGDKEKARTYD